VSDWKWPLPAVRNKAILRASSISLWRRFERESFGSMVNPGVLVRYEQPAAHAAQDYARSTGMAIMKAVATTLGGSLGCAGDRTEGH